MRRGDAGFTLIEALVAMVILALAAVALIGATEAHIRNVNGLESRAVAQWVAENHLVELRLARNMSAEDALPVQMLDREWRVDARIKPTADPDLVAVDILVAEAGTTAPLVTLGGFLDIAAAAP